MTTNLLRNAPYCLFFLVVLGLGGCLKSSAPVYYYTLTADEPGQVSGTAASTDSCPSTLLVGPIRIASPLDQRQIARQQSPNSLTLAEQHRWAGDLPQMISDVMISNLSRDLDNCPVYTFPDTSEPEGLQLEIYILHFEKDLDGRAWLSTRWKLISTNSHDDVRHSRNSVHRIPLEGNSYDDLALGLSQSLALLSHEISSVVENIQR